MEEQKDIFEKLCKVLEIREEQEREEKIDDIMRIIKLIDVVKCSQDASEHLKQDKQREMNSKLIPRGIIADLQIESKIVINGNDVPEDVLERVLYLRDKLQDFMNEECSQKERDFLTGWREQICRI